MATTKVEVGVEADAAGSISEIDKLTKRVEELSKSFESTAKKASKGAKVVKGSFSALEKELKDNVKQLKNMEVGSKAFDLQRKKVAQLSSQLRKVKGQMGGATTAAGGLRTAAAGAVGKIAGIASGMISVQAAISAIVNELEHAKQLQIKAGVQERTLEGALADIALNIGGEQLPEARAMIEERAVDLGTTQAGLANLLGVAISAGAKDLKQAMEVSAAALEISVGDAAKSQELVGAALDITSLSGSEDFRAALGQVSQVQSQVRSVNAAQFFANIGPALAAATADRENVVGLSTERALELSGVISQIIKDPTGSTTATTVTQFVSRLDAFVPKLSQTLKDGSKATLTKQQIEKFQATTTMDERIGMMRQSPAMARQFLEEQEEGKGKVAAMEIVQGSVRALGFEKKAAAGIDSLVTSGAAFDSLVAGINKATPHLRAVRTGEAALEQSKTAGSRGTVGTAWELLRLAREGTDRKGLDAMTTWVEDTGIKAMSDPADQIKEIERILVEIAGWGSGGPDSPNFKQHRTGAPAITTEGRQNAKEQLAALQKLVANTTNRRTHEDEIVPAAAPVP